VAHDKSHPEEQGIAIEKRGKFILLIQAMFILPKLTAGRT